MVLLRCSWAGDRSGGPCGCRDRSPEKLVSQLKAGRGRGEKLGSQPKAGKGRGLGAACSSVALTEVDRLREESATRSSDLRLFRLAAAPPTPTTLGREYGVSRCRDVQLKALRSCQAQTTCQPHTRRVRHACARCRARTAGEGRGLGLATHGMLVRLCAGLPSGSWSLDFPPAPPSRAGIKAFCDMVAM